MANIEFYLYLLGLSTFVFFVLFLTLLMNKGQQKAKIKRLKRKLEKLEEELESRKLPVTPPKQSATTNLEYIKKIEALEKELSRERKRLKETKIIAQEANKIKAEFLSNVRHEIRTPMNSIMVFANLLDQELMEEKLKSYTQNIINSGRKLLKLLDHIIELSNVEGGSFEVKEEPTDIVKLLQSVIKKHESKAKKKALDLSLHIDKNVPDFFIVDQEKITEILDSLIENAIKFTDKGFVKVSVKTNGKNILKNALNLSFTVEDSGIGLKPEDTTQIFEMFEKPESDDEKERGAGIGLSINRKMARAMNGDIFVSSELNRGSIFTFTLNDAEVLLPSAEMEDELHENIDFSLLKGKYNRAVVIDGDMESRGVIKNNLSKSSIEVIGFDNSKEAVTMLQLNRVDIIFVDIDLFTADDNALSKILTKISSAAVVTITSKRLKDVELEENANITGHLMRPIAVEPLFKVTAKALHFTPTDIINEENIEEEAVVEKSSTKEHREKFLSLAKRDLDPLFEKAHITNDLDSIELFAKGLHSLVQKYDIEELKEYADKLVQKVELFDIDAMQSLMKEYNERIEKLENL
jgi:polar amino acid transport system substrate-binding protein